MARKVPHFSGITSRLSKPLQVLITLMVASSGLLTSQGNAGATTFINWDQYLFDNAHSSVNTGAVAITTANAASLTQAWTWTPGSFSGRAAPTIQVNPTVHDGIIYIGTGSGHFYALNEADGTPLTSGNWGTDGIDLGYSFPCPKKRPTDEQGIANTATVAYDSSRSQYVIYIASPAGRSDISGDTSDTGGRTGGVFINALALDGSFLWRKRVVTQSGSFPYASPLVLGGHVYVGVGSYCDGPLVRGGIKEFNQSDGALVHTYWATPSGTVGASVWTTPVTDGTYIWTTLGNGSSGDSFGLVRLTTTLTKIEKWKVPGVSGTDDDFGASPTFFRAIRNGVSTRMIGACDKNGYFYVFKHTNIAGGPIWKYKVALFHTGPDRCLASAVWDSVNGRLFVAGPSTTIGATTYLGSIRRLNPATGAVVWQQGLSAPVNGTPTLNGSGVLALHSWYYGASTNRFWLYDAATGSQLKEYSDLGSAPGFGQPVFADNFIFRPTNNSGLIAYHP